MGNTRLIKDELPSEIPEKREALDFYREGLSRIGGLDQPAEILVVWESVENALAKSYKRGHLSEEEWGQLDMQLSREVKAKADSLHEVEKLPKESVVLTENEIQEIESLNDKKKRPKARECFIETVARMEAVGRSASLFQLCSECEVKLLNLYADSPDKNDDFGKWHFLLGLRMRQIITGEG